MSWFNSGDRDLPDKLKGKKSDDILKAIEDGERAAADKAAADAAKLKAENDLAASQTELQTMKQRLAQLEANAPRGQQQERQQPQGPPSVLLDEEAAFQARLGPVYVTMATQGAITAQQVAVSQINDDPVKAKLYRKYKAEVDKRFGSCPLDSKVHPATYLNCFNVVLGEHLGELTDAAAKREGEFAVEPAGNGPQQPSTERSDKLADDELAIAKRMGVTPEKYLEQRKRMQFVGA